MYSIDDDSVTEDPEGQTVQECRFESHSIMFWIKELEETLLV